MFDIQQPFVSAVHVGKIKETVDKYIEFGSAARKIEVKSLFSWKFWVWKTFIWGFLWNTVFDIYSTDGLGVVRIKTPNLVFMFLSVTQEKEASRIQAKLWAQNSP